LITSKIRERFFGKQGKDGKEASAVGRKAGGDLRFTEQHFIE